MPEVYLSAHANTLSKLHVKFKLATGPIGSQWVGFLQNSELERHDKLERLRRQKERTRVLKFAIPRTRAIAHPEINVGELRWVTRSAGWSPSL